MAAKASGYQRPLPPAHPCGFAVKFIPHLRLWSTVGAPDGHDLRSPRFAHHTTAAFSGDYYDTHLRYCHCEARNGTAFAPVRLTGIGEGT